VLAAINKFRLSPSIEKNGAVLKLRNSILLEIVFSTVIAAITTYFTTVIGIAHG
jgi:putative copper export protein